ncbi:MAG: family 16 glycosylhydrolase [Bacteroidota bacterium]
MKSQCMIVAFIGLFANKLQGQDWVDVPIPAAAGNGRIWKIQEQHSDDFNYSGKGTEFISKWLDNHRTGWSGPGETQFSSDYSDVNDGNLKIKAGRATGIEGKTVFCGHVTSKTSVIYPVFTEVSMKCSGINLSSNFWLISADDVSEIDVTETYGAEDPGGRVMQTNYHIFQRSPFTDLANAPKQHFAKKKVFLKDAYHTFGLYWKSETEFEFYLDGKLVRELNPSKDLEDPRDRFFDQAMYLIMNTELHTWKSSSGIKPSDAELNDDTINVMYIDWIRTYKPVPDT